MAVLLAALLATRRVGTAPPRLAVLDASRGIAVLGMIAYHGVWDASILLPDLAIDAESPAMLWLRSAVLSLFLVLAGMGCALARLRGVDAQSHRRRLSRILAAALAITVLSLWLVPDAPVLFGALHFLVVASPLGLLAARLPSVALAVLAVLPLVLAEAGSAVWSGPWLMVTGIGPIRPVALDYVPLCPWLAPFLLGVAVGRWPLALSALARLKAPAGRGFDLLARLGRYSLAVYLLHQPVLIAAIALVALLTSTL